MRRRRDLSRLHPSRDVGSLWAKHLGDPREERVFIGAASFFGVFALTRAITHSIRAGIGPFGNLSPGGRHIHHMTFGITGLLVTGYLWINEIGIAGAHDRRRASRFTSLLYGAGSALTLDEFALWLNLEDDYWSKEGRESIDAVVLFGGVLCMALLSRNMLAELAGTLVKPRGGRVNARARRLALQRPRAALESLTRRAR